MMGTLYRDKTDVALALVCGVLREGGATVSTRTNDVVPVSGYLVGGARPPYVTQSDALHPADLVAWLERTDVPAFAYVGAWVDHGAGFEGKPTLVYFDVSEHYLTLRGALTVARERGELAIWSLDTNAEIRTEAA